MAYNYDPDDKFGYKDTLPEDHPEKIITGVEFDDEFKKIESGMGDLQVEIDAIVNSGAITEAPEDGYTYGRNNKTWVPVADKNHEHDLDDVNNLVATLTYLQSQINDLESGAIDPDHGHEISDINQLQAELDKLTSAITGITSGLVFGGTYDLANDTVMRSLKEDEGLMEGQPLPADGTIFDTFLILLSGGEFRGEQMSRADWIVADEAGTWIPIPYSTAGAVDWGNITGKPNTYPPGPHNHDGVYQPVGDYLTDSPVNDSQYVRQGGEWVINAGVIGPEGPTGPKGDKGETGDKGDDGVDGKGWTSGSYNASNGVVTFTSDDGLGFVTGDLRGSDGKDGTDGQDGQSIQGPAGPGWTGGTYDANTGVVTFTSNDGLGFSTTDIRGEQGIQGPAGEKGERGEKGDKGDTGADSTVVGPQGPEGPQGPKGDTGADSTVPGPEGPQGPQGPAGPKGADSTVAGPQGPAGPKGDTGPAGQNGSNGAQGPKGDKGDTGSTGPQGPKGDTGAKGSTGAQGPAGTSATPNSAGNGLAISGSTFYMSGSYTGSFTATGDVTAYSDEALKENIVPAPIGIIESLRGVEFTWIEDGKQGSGVIAQEVEKILPHLIHDHEDGHKSVNYNGLIAYLIEEVKSLKAEVEALRDPPQ